MPIDIQRILESAAKTAVEQGAQAARAPSKPEKRRLSTGKAMLLGAGLATAGRLVVTHKGRDMLRRVQRQIADSKWLEDREPADAEDNEDYEPEPEDLGDEELSAEDEEVDDSPDLDQEPDADPDEDGSEDEDADADEDGSPEAEPKRPPRRRTRQRGRA